MPDPPPPDCPGPILVWDAETPDVGHTAAAEPNVDRWSDDEG